MAFGLYQYLSVGEKGNKHAWLEYEFDRLGMFEVIYLCFDNDAEGKMAITELAERLGAHRNARSLDPAELKRADHFVEQVIEEFYPSNDKPRGIIPPWEKAQDKILFRPDEFSVWTGINGHGKSQLLGQIMLYAIKQNVRVCIASLELKPD